MFAPSRFMTELRQRDMLRRQGFTAAQIAGLMAYRTDYGSGRFAHDTPTDRHLAFGRWLYQRGKISG